MGRSTLSPNLRFRVLERDGFRCQYCGVGAANETLEVDHITPVSAGGSDEMVNLITACWPCNRGKHARRVEGRPPLGDPVYWRHPHINDAYERYEVDGDFGGVVLDRYTFDVTLERVLATALRGDPTICFYTSGLVATPLIIGTAKQAIEDLGAGGAESDAHEAWRLASIAAMFENRIFPPKEGRFRPLTEFASRRAGLFTIGMLFLGMTEWSRAQQEHEEAGLLYDPSEDNDFDDREAR